MARRRDRKSSSSRAVGQDAGPTTFVYENRRSNGHTLIVDGPRTPAAPRIVDNGQCSPRTRQLLVEPASTAKHYVAFQRVTDQLMDDNSCRTGCEYTDRRTMRRRRLQLASGFRTGERTLESTGEWPRARCREDQLLDGASRQAIPADLNAEFEPASSTDVGHDGLSRESHPNALPKRHQFGCPSRFAPSCRRGCASASDQLLDSGHPLEGLGDFARWTASSRHGLRLGSAHRASAVHGGSPGTRCHCVAVPGGRELRKLIDAVFYEDL